MLAFLSLILKKSLSQKFRIVNKQFMGSPKKFWNSKYQTNLPSINLVYVFHKAFTQKLLYFQKSMYIVHTISDEWICLYM